MVSDPTSRNTDGGYDWGLTDKCGQCYEVVCVDGATRGKDWSELGPWGGCQVSLPATPRLLDSRSTQVAPHCTHSWSPRVLVSSVRLRLTPVCVAVAWREERCPKEAGKKSVTVMISDSCPCHHPNSSNKRWCCGDRTHLDLSYAAFDQIAVRHRGVVDLKVRPADCSKQGSVAFYK